LALAIRAGAFSFGDGPAILFWLSLCGDNEPDPVFGQREPGIAVFRLSSANSAIQAFLSMLAIAISVGGHTQPQKSTDEKWWQ